MIAEVLAVGTELLMGQISNTNAQYISNRLPDVGIGVYYHSVVGDNPKRLKEVLNIALNRSDLIIMTGGLGPTQDDLTKETVAEAFGKKLVRHEESYNIIKAFFEKVGRPMAQNNVKQAYLPEGSLIVKNSNGTAPGCIIEENGKIVVMLPGPPSEMKPMFEGTVIPYLKNKMDDVIVSKYIRVFGIGESAMEERIIDLIENQKNPTIAPYAKEGECMLRITARSDREEDAEKIMEPVIAEIQSRLGDSVYALEDKSLEAVVGEALIKKNVTLSLAESCTGGLIAAKLTAIPGVSSVFNRGFVTYSNQSKMENLGVNKDTLEKYGAVSRETVLEMAEGARKSAKTCIAAAVTGIAGPDGGTPEKPVGLVHIALSFEGGNRHKELKLWGGRDRIRNVTCLHVFDMIRRYLEGME